MAKVNFVVSYWKQSTGLTGQNLNEDNARKFDRIAKKYEKKTGKRLSKVRAYKASRHAARLVKAEFGSRIVSNSKSTFELLLTAVDRTLDRKNHAIDLGAFNVQDILELAQLPTGASAHKRKSA
jgi:hypothetical protein